MAAGLGRYGEDSYFEVGSRYVEYRDGADDQSGGWEDLYFDHYVSEGGVGRGHVGSDGVVIRDSDRSPRISPDLSTYGESRAVGMVAYQYIRKINHLCVHLEPAFTSRAVRSLGSQSRA